MQRPSKGSGQGGEGKGCQFEVEGVVAEHPSTIFVFTNGDTNPSRWGGDEAFVEQVDEEHERHRDEVEAQTLISGIDKCWRNNTL